uniref:Chorismate synthase n=1 Tax=Davidia involucrata TaxID=16924 RepID=A0A5B7AAV6_DAVIN
MSLENEDQSSPDKLAETLCEYKKHSKISYSRDFILSLSELDICKKLPSGFDQSILSEFEGTFHGIQDRQRIPGSLPLQSFRRNEYGSSPPTRGDSSNYSWGIHGRSDNRSSGRSDRDSDLQSDLDSDSGRRYGIQSRWSWQSSEHDGLLGSGSFPRPSGYAGGVSAPKVQANDHYQLNKSNELYHPPRPYKAIPHSRRETNDSYNDETFGSSECTSQDRAEEERRRKASFELMRKEQHKALQEKPKLNLDKHKDEVSDITAFLEDTKDEKRLLNRNNELDESVALQDSNNDSGKSSFPSQSPASRPLVPPGFRSTLLERNSGMKSLIHTHPVEVGKPEIEESLSHTKANPVQNGTLDDQEERKSAQGMVLSEQQHENPSIRAPFLNKGDKIVNPSSALQVSNNKLGMDDQLYRTSSLSEALETLDSGEIIELDTKKVTGHKIVGDSNQDHPASILDKLFGTALTVNIGGSSSGFIEQHDSKPDDTWSPNTVQSSKFAHWFLEDEKKPADELSSGKPNDLLSLIVGGEKGGSQVPDVKATQHIPPEFPFQSSELANRHMTSNITSATIGISRQLYSSNKQEAVPTVLTCEDLEQTILSKFSENSSTLQQTMQGRSVSGGKIDQPKEDVNNHASQHLLSLLQKGTCLKDVTPSPNLDIESPDKLHVSEVANIGTVLDNQREANTENILNTGKNVTLETLFGSAFMQELQSAEAPVSVQRGSVGSARIDVPEPHGLSFPVIGDGLFSSTVSEIGSNRTSHESNVLASNQRQQIKSDKFENWLGFNDPQVEVDSSMSKLDGFDGAMEIQLPEEESLITAGDPVNPLNTMFMPAGNLTKGEFLSSNTPVDIAEKLAALNTVFKDERSMVGQEGPPFVRGPYDLMEPEIPYRNLHAQPSSPQFHSPQMNHGRPLFHPLDSHPAHINPQMKFMAPESIIHHDGPPNHQFPANMLRPPFHHPNTGLTGFDLPAHHPMLQQMQMPGNFPPPHLLRQFPRGAPLPPQPNNQATGFMQELNPMQGFPFGHRQPNFGGLGMPLQAPDVSRGSSHPEALQRLIEMELRANSKQIHPYAAVGHSQEMYGHELDMGFRYR